MRDYIIMVVIRQCVNMCIQYEYFLLYQMAHFQGVSYTFFGFIQLKVEY